MDIRAEGVRSAETEVSTRQCPSDAQIQLDPIRKARAWRTHVTVGVVRPNERRSDVIYKVRKPVKYTAGFNSGIAALCPAVLHTYSDPGFVSFRFFERYRDRRRFSDSTPTSSPRHFNRPNSKFDLHTTDSPDRGYLDAWPSINADGPRIAKYDNNKVHSISRTLGGFPYRPHQLNLIVWIVINLT